jgi:hypothetical protein
MFAIDDLLEQCYRPVMFPASLAEKEIIKERKSSSLAIILLGTTLLIWA